MKLFASLGPISVFMVLVTLMCEGLIISLDLGHHLADLPVFSDAQFQVLVDLVGHLHTGHVGHLFAWLYFILREYFIEWSQDENRRGQKIYRWLVRGKTTYSEADRQRDQQRVRRLAIISIPLGFVFRPPWGLTSPC